MAQVAAPPQAVEPGYILKPTFNVVSVAELEGSSYLLSADGKGFVSCWDVSPVNSSENVCPVLYEPAHEEGINQVLLLRSSRISEVIEANEWQQEEQRLLRLERAKAKSRSSFKERSSLKVTPEEKGAEEEGLPADGSAASKDGAERENSKGEAQPGIEAVPEEEEEEPEDEESEEPRKCRRCLERCFPCLGLTTGGDRHWLVATASEDGTVRIWRWRQVPKRMFDQKDPDYYPVAVDFITEWCSDPKAPVLKCLELFDGHLAVALKNSCDVRLIDPSTSTLKWVLFGHTKPVTCLAECADGRLVSGACDGAIRLWDRRSWVDKSAASAKDQLQRTADSGFESEPPAAPYVGWQDAEALSPSAGVCSMAYFAHMQQARRGECASMCLRVLIERAENLPKADTLSLSDPYVVCTLLDGMGSTRNDRTDSSCTPDSRTGEWNHQCTLAIQKQMLGGSMQCPACSFIDFEVVVKGKLWHFSRPDQVLARCSLSLEKVLADIARAPDELKVPSAQKLYSPLGEGPRKELKDALIFLGFSQSSEGSIDVEIQSAQGVKLPFWGLGQSMYVRVKIRQSSASKVNRLPAKVQDKTSVQANTCNPHFNEVLEFEVPVFIGDRHISHSPEYCLHFEIWDQDLMLPDEFLGDLIVPITEAFARDGEPAQPYNCTLAKGRSAHVVNRRNQPAAQDGEEKRSSPSQRSLHSQKSMPPEAQPRLSLAFQTLVPCPKQIKCTVDRLSGLTTLGGKDSLEMRMRFVEGNPMMPAETAVQTSWKRQTLKPVWKERCVLDIPKQLREFDRDNRAAAVKHGWMHESRDESETVVICVDIYDRDPVLGRDEYICRGSISFMHAYSAAMDGSGLRPKPIRLTCNSEAKLWLGFEIGDDPDTLVVFVSHAENLEARDMTGASDPFCVVRFASLSQLGEPTDEVKLPGLGTVTAGLSKPGAVRGAAHWNHTEILDVPGAFKDGILAARPNWFLQFDLVNPKRDVVLSSAAIPVEEIMDSISATAKEQINNTSRSIRERLEDLRMPLRKTATRDPFEVEDECSGIQRRLTFEQLDKPRKQAEEQKQSKTLQVKASGRRMSTMASPKATEALGSALVALGLRENTERKDLGYSGVQLHVRFEVVSRWKGAARTSRAPPSQPMSGPSPVTCIAVLASSIVAGHEDGNVFVWDAAERTSAPLHQFQAHRVPVSAITVLAPLGCVVTAGEVRNKEEAASDSLLRLWSSVNLELRQTLSLHGAVARCLSPLALGAEMEEIKRAAEMIMKAEGKAREKVMDALPPCLAIGTDSRQAKHLQLMKVHFGNT